MKKKSIIVTTLLSAAMLLSVPTYAQVFLQEEEMEGSLRATHDGSFVLGAPGHGGTGDSGPENNYTPLGSGAIVLGCLGGAYLLGRRRKERE